MDSLVFVIGYTALILLLVWLIAYLKERANDDDQWPQG